MPVRIHISYEGDLRCQAVHGPSGEQLRTEAPVDNGGKGEHFSPTDLVAAALGSCMLTNIGARARRAGIDVAGASVVVEKEMGSTPRRHISRLKTTVTLPAIISPEERGRIEAAARACPVAASLGPQTELAITFEYRSP